MMKRIKVVLALAVMLISSLFIAACGESKKAEFSISESELFLAPAAGANTAAIEVLPESIINKVEWDIQPAGIVTYVATFRGIRVTAVQVGDCTITASYNGETRICLVQVRDIPVDSVSIVYDGRPLIAASGSDPEKLNIEDEYKTVALTATVQPGTAAIQGVTWVSEDTDIATVDPVSGFVTAVKPGTATITAVSLDEEANKSDSVEITVEAPTPITTAAGLRDLTDYENDIEGYYYLADNIDATDADWKVLGNLSGVFDGMGHTVTIKSDSVTGVRDDLLDGNGDPIDEKKQPLNVGIFRAVNTGAAVKNLAVKGGTADAPVIYDDWGGGIAQDNFGTISDCLADICMVTPLGSVNGLLGGIACNNVLPGIISNCVVLSTINGLGTAASGWNGYFPANGGIAVGSQDRSEPGAILNCFFSEDKANAFVSGDQYDEAIAAAQPGENATAAEIAAAEKEIQRLTDERQEHDGGREVLFSADVKLGGSFLIKNNGVQLPAPLIVNHTTVRLNADRTAVETYTYDEETKDYEIDKTYVLDGDDTASWFLDYFTGGVKSSSLLIDGIVRKFNDGNVGLATGIVIGFKFVMYAFGKDVYDNTGMVHSYPDCPKTTEEMKEANLYTEFDDEIWLISDGSLPELRELV